MIPLTPDQLARLPKYAREHIEKRERQLAEALQKLQASWQLTEPEPGVFSVRRFRSGIDSVNEGVWEYLPVPGGFAGAHGIWVTARPGNPPSKDLGRQLQLSTVEQHLKILPQSANAVVVFT